MVKHQSDSLNEIFGALADPTRRAILARLALGEITVGELAEPFEMSLPAVSKHLNVLEAAGLVQREKQGRLRRCQLDGRPLEAAAGWIEEYRRFWEAQLDSLARYLEQTQTQQSKEGKKDGGGKRDR
jgi:DNA-binding transcriptional ArsR family regulator